MADVVTQQLVQGLKNYFKKEELSDKILHIYEIDENFLAPIPIALPSSSKKRKSASTGEFA